MFSSWLLNTPGDLPHPGIELGSPALQADALTSELLGFVSMFYIFLGV